LGLVAGLAAVGSLLWGLGFSRSVITGLANEVTIIGLGIAAVAAVIAAAVARLRRTSSLLTAVAAGIVALLMVPQVDAALSDAGTWRVFETGWQAYLDDVLAQAPPNGHVVIRAA